MSQSEWSLTERRAMRREYWACPYKTVRLRQPGREKLAELWQQTKGQPPQNVWDQLGAIAKGGDGGELSGSEFKAAFRTHLLKIQNNRCCYCGRWLVSTAYARHIDHILPKSVYPQFSLDYWNLAVACVECNSLKKKDVWGCVARDRRKYPGPQAFGDIFHPRFHRYDAHLRMFRLETNQSCVVIFRGLTEQGRFLCKTLLHKVAAKEMLVGNNPALREAADNINTGVATKGGDTPSHLETFRQALERSLMRVLEVDVKT